ncbi:MAG: DUF5670 family protein [Deltaproteobacteria bacterium]|nr:DUF5670 family protein [Deltaproteobacteria bacterium]
MLRAIAVVMIFLWMLGLGAGDALGSFIHLFYVAALALLVVSVSLEVMLNRKLRRGSRGSAQPRIGEKLIWW